MKRKHDDAGAATTAEEPVAESLVDDTASFSSFSLDARLLRAVADLNYAHPTLVQAKAIPLALEGKDILARAKTGSGKTAAYLLPILQGALNNERALVLVPTKELADQVLRMAEKLKKYCDKAVKVVNIAQNVSEMVQRTLLADNPHVVVATPSRALLHTKLNPTSLTTGITRLVIDEADLLLSYGYEDDLQSLTKSLPRGLQTFLMSATLTPEVETLKTLFCRSPAILRLEEDETAEQKNNLTQFIVKCGEDEKFLLTYVIFKLKLIKGKVLIFVADIDRCYRLKLFLEQFGIRSCVLNSELPVNSRLHIVEEFNKNVYDIIIATDDAEVLTHEADSDDESSQPAPSTSTDPTPPTDSKTKKRRKVTHKRDKESSTSRGIDFHRLSAVLNFDLPTSSRLYTHRIGRTARADLPGIALSFIIPSDLYRKHPPTSIPSTAHDEKVLARITKSQAKRGHTLKPYVFDMTQVDGFRYRMEDALRSVTRQAVREARVREVKRELVMSEKLKRHWEENPDELKMLRHDVESASVRVRGELKHVPEYLLPGKGRKVGGEGEAKEEDMSVAMVRKRKKESEGNRIRVKRQAGRGRGKSTFGGRKDPLKAFSKARK
ncbi:ATP-dependent RNA helicase DBP9 [Ascodesmis nigricans]|uniref:RNA helicase n=1 Tax=Ascodesmis nigricans TaxID=341454 RepID=A0A4S2N7T2_9PEZI|nr:ATP-dependent RNA helicase DBP9 [Ascodesmis nigricans]